MLRRSGLEEALRALKKPPPRNGNGASLAELVRSRGEKSPPPNVDCGEYGCLQVQNSKLYVLTQRQHEAFGPLAPLFFSSKVKEVFASPSEIVATHAEYGRLPVVVGVNFLDWFDNLRIHSRVYVSRKRPIGTGWVGEWRIAFKIPPATREPQVTAVHLSVIPPAESYDPLLVARLATLLLAGKTTVVYGPPGSGKTTFLSSLLQLIRDTFPTLHLVIVEREPETVVRGGMVTHAASGNTVPISELLTEAFTKWRPDVLALGELWSEDISVWINVSRTRSITTTHAGSIEELLVALDERIRHSVPGSGEGTVLQHFRVYVEVLAYRPQAAYVSDGQFLYPLFSEGRHMPDAAFRLYLPRKVQLGQREWETPKLYELLLQRLGADPSRLDGWLEPLKLALRQGRLKPVEE